MPLSACCRLLSRHCQYFVERIYAANVGRVCLCGGSCHIFSYMLIVVGQKSLRPTVAGMYNYIQPIVSCIVTICLGMDHFNLVKGCAVVLIFGGVYLVTISRTRQELEQHEAQGGDVGKVAS